MSKRSLAWVAILSIVTLGFYDLYWLYITRKELVAKGQSVPPVFLLLIPTLLGFVAMGVMFYQLLRVYSNQTETVAKGAESTVAFFLIVMVIAAIAFLAIAPFWMYRYCKAAEAATHGKLDFTTTYILCIVLYFFGFWFIWPIIVQDAFNKSEIHPSAPSSQPIV